MRTSAHNLLTSYGRSPLHQVNEILALCKRMTLKINKIEPLEKSHDFFSIHGLNSAIFRWRKPFGFAFIV
jgi:hypothetical protein